VRRKYLRGARAPSAVAPSQRWREREKDALPDVVAAGRLDEHLVHVALGALVHALVDLVDEGERRAGELGEREQVRHGRQSALLRAGKRTASERARAEAHEGESERRERGGRTPPDWR